MEYLNQELVRMDRQGSENTCIQYKREIESRIEGIIAKETESAAFRSKCTHYREGNKNSKYFYSLEKARYNKKTMSRIIDDNNLILDTPREILAEQHRFYSELYKKDENVRFRFKNMSQIQISEEDKISMDAPITLDELTEAVKSMKHNKSPGGDGITAEFMQFFWSRLKHLFYDAVNFAKEIGTLHVSARRGVIQLIPKRQKNPEKLKNWRPLTMLPIFYKVLAKALATRLKAMLPNIISENQNGFMEKRQISASIRVTMDIARHNKNVNGYLLLLDFNKCFDRIEYTAIRGSLNYFNFGNNFIEWVDLLLNEFTACTTNNGHASPYFDVSRSAHQGCPLAPYLFLLCGEVMAHKIKENSNINGIKINQLEQIISQFADDTQLFLENQRSVEEVLKVLKALEGNIGLKVNHEKSCIHSIGDAKPFKCTENLVWDPGKIEVLGVEITADANVQYFETLQKAKVILKKWENRTLPLLGKINVINTLVTSLFVYKMQVLEDPSEEFYKEYDKMIANYLWNGKKAKIRTNVLQGLKTEGGVKLVNMRVKNQSLKLAWIFKSDKYSKNQLRTIASTELGETIWNCSLNTKDAETELFKDNAQINQFWGKVTRDWFNTTWKKQHRNIDCIRQVREQVLWLNSHIQIGNKCVRNPEVCKAGMLYVKDIMTERNVLKSYEELEDNWKTNITWYQYLQICKAIPKRWLTLKNNYEKDEYVHMYDFISAKEKKIKTLYIYLIENQSTKDLNDYFRSMRNKIDLNYEEYIKAFRDINKITHIVKYKDFQYRLLVNAIFTNDRLFHWKKVNSQKCEWCDEPKQNITHMLYKCNTVRKVWHKLMDFLLKCTEVNCTELEMNCKNVMLNTVHTKVGHIVNFIVLIIKQNIFANKCLGLPIKFENIIEKVKEIYQTELYNSKIDYRYSSLKTKWLPYSGEYK